MPWKAGKLGFICVLRCLRVQRIACGETWPGVVWLSALPEFADTDLALKQQQQEKVGLSLWVAEAVGAGH